MRLWVLLLLQRTCRLAASHALVHRTSCGQPVLQFKTSQCYYMAEMSHRWHALETSSSADWLVKACSCSRIPSCRSSGPISIWTPPDAAFACTMCRTTKSELIRIDGVGGGAVVDPAAVVASVRCAGDSVTSPRVGVPSTWTPAKRCNASAGATSHSGLGYNPTNRWTADRQASPCQLY